jgi:hypothetical protein
MGSMYKAAWSNLLERMEAWRYCTWTHPTAPGVVILVLERISGCAIHRAESKLRGSVKTRAHVVYLRYRFSDAPMRRCKALYDEIKALNISGAFYSDIYTREK